MIIEDGGDDARAGMLKDVKERSIEEILAASAPIEGGADQHKMSVDENGVMHTGVFNSDVKMLSPEAIAPYLESMIYRLAKTKEFVSDTRYAKLMDKITEQYNLVQLMYRSQKNGYTKVPFAIDPTDSGMPHTGIFQFLQDDKAKAQEILGRIGNIDEIIAKASDRITRLEFPSDEQAHLAEYEYFSRLLEFSPIPLVKVGNVADEKHKDKAGGESHFKMEWYGVDSRFSGFMLYKMNFTTPGNAEPREDTELEGVLRGTFWHPLELVFFNIDESSNLVHPKKITRLKIGPYYNTETINDPVVDRIFQEYLSGPGKKEEDPFFLKVTKEVIESVRTEERKKSVKKKFVSLFFETGEKAAREVPSGIKQHDYWMTNFRIKQMLNSSNGEYASFRGGDFNNILGLTRKGDLT